MAPEITTFESRSLDPFYTGGTCSISDDGNLLATTLGEEAVVTNLLTGEVTEIEGDSEVLTCLQITGDGNYLITCSRSLQMRIYALPDGRLLRSIKAHESPVMSMAVDPTSTLVATGGAEGAVKVWDIRGGYSTHVFRGHGGIVSCIAFGPEYALASGGADGNIRLWDLASRKSLAALSNHVSAVRGLAFTDNGRELLSAGRDKIISRWILNGKNTSLDGIIMARDPLEAVGILDDGHIYCAGEAGKIWIISGSEIVNESQVADGSITDVLKSQHLLHAVTTNHSIIGYTADKNVLETKRVSGYFGEIVDCCYVAGSRLAVATNTSDIKLLSLESLRKGMQDLQVLEQHSDAVIALAASSDDGRWLCSGGKDKQARVWDMQECGAENEGKASCSLLTGHTGTVSAVAISRDGRFVITGAQDLTIKRWDIRGSKQNSKVVERPTAAYTRVAHQKDINAIAISPDNRFFATASQDKTVKVWDADTAECVGILQGHRRGVWTVQFGNKNLITGSGDKTVKLWSLSNFSCIRTFEGHVNTVLKVQYMKNDHSRIASAGGDGLVKIWDTNTGDNLVTLDNHEEKVWTLAYQAGSADETRDELISGGADSVLTVWTDVSQEETQREEAKRALRVEEEQAMSNYLLKGDLKGAILIALSLGHPGKLLGILQRILAESPAKWTEVDGVVKSLSDADLGNLLVWTRDWNTNGRTSEVAQRVIGSVLRVKTVEEISAVKSISELLHGLIAYSERHYARTDELIEQTYALDYVLERIDVLSVAD